MDLYFKIGDNMLAIILMIKLIYLTVTKFSFFC